MGINKNAIYFKHCGIVFYLSKKRIEISRKNARNETLALNPASNANHRAQSRAACIKTVLSFN